MSGVGYQPKGDVNWRTLTPPKGTTAVQPPPPVRVQVERKRKEPQHGRRAD